MSDATNVSPEENRLPVFPLADVAIAFLVHGSDEPVLFSKEGVEALVEGLDLLFHQPGFDRRTSVHQLLALADLLEREHRSPSAAASIVSALQACRPAVSLLSQSKNDGRRIQARARRLIGSHLHRLAPPVDAPSPEGSFKLKNLVPPTSPSHLARRR